MTDTDRHEPESLVAKSGNSAPDVRADAGAALAAIQGNAYLMGIGELGGMTGCATIQADVVLVRAVLAALTQALHAALTAEPDSTDHAAWQQWHDGLAHARLIAAGTDTAKEEAAVPPPPEPTEHELKCWPPFFDAVLSGRKPFELRQNDRDYKVCDTLLLTEWTPRGYTGRLCRKEITYVLGGSEFGLDDGYVALGLADVGRSVPDSAKEEVGDAAGGS